MPFNITETPNVDSFKSAWGDMVEAIEPDLESLPQPWKDTFSGPLKLLIGSKLSLGIIPPQQQWALNEKLAYIVTLLKYPDFVDYNLDYIAGEIAELFGVINLSDSLNGKFLLEGPMSRHFTTQTSRLVGVDKFGKEKTLNYGGENYG